MQNTHIKYFIKTDTSRRNTDRDIEKVKSGYYDNYDRSPVGKVYTNDILYLYMDIEITKIHDDSTRMTTRRSDKTGLIEHDFDAWNVTWVMFEDGTEFMDIKDNFEDFKNYVESGDNYIDLDDIIM